jgi:hypothetical protein
MARRDILLPAELFPDTEIKYRLLILWRSMKAAPLLLEWDRRM